MKYQQPFNLRLYPWRSPEFKAPEGCLYTQSTDGKRLYLHLLTYPFKYLIAEGLADPN